MVTGQRTYWAYLLAALTTVALCFAGMFFLSGTDWFSLHDGYPALRNVGYSVRAQHLDCDILLWGDSSALTGLDPGLISARTGLSACNAAEGLTTQLVVGSDLPLRMYLGHNKPPRIIVGMWSYASFRPEVPPHTTYTPEGMFYALRYMGRLRSLSMLLFSGHPHWVPRYLIWAAANLTPWTSSAKGEDALQERATRAGLFQFPLPPQDACTRNAAIFGGGDAIPSWPASVSSFRAHYSTPQTAVIVDISPIPDCNRNAALYKQKTDGLHDNPLVAVPIRFFNNGDLHFSPEGSNFISEQVARQVNEALRR